MQQSSPDSERQQGKQRCFSLWSLKGGVHEEHSACDGPKQVLHWRSHFWHTLRKESTQYTCISKNIVIKSTVTFIIYRNIFSSLHQEKEDSSWERISLNLSLKVTYKKNFLIINLPLKIRKKNPIYFNHENITENKKVIHSGIISSLNLCYKNKLRGSFSYRNHITF